MLSLRVSQNLEKSAVAEAAEYLKIGKSLSSLAVEYREGTGWACSFSDGVLSVCAPGKHYAFRALFLLARNGCKPFSVTEDRAFESHGVMLDCSRDAVILPSRVREYVLLLALMGYDAVQLYTEDTYELDGEPYFGYLRGRYSKQDLKELDRYAARFGVTLVPCIQTLAHLNGIFRWQVYADVHDIDDVLLVDEDKTYALIEKMFASIAECFTSRTVNIGMDEAFRIGCGKYAQTKGFPENRMEMMLRHVNRVAAIAEKYGFTCAMWSDMFYRIAFNGYYSEENPMLDGRVGEKIPRNVELVYWDYYSDSEERYDAVLRQHAAFSRNIWFAGGAWTWLGFLPNNSFSMRAAQVSIAACRKNGVKKSFLAMWGDNGAECSVFAVLPALFYAAEYAYGNRPQDNAEAFFRLTGESLSAFLLLEEADRVGNYLQSNFTDPTKYVLYSDCFAGIYDCLLREEDGEKFGEIAARCREHERGKWGYIFSYVRALCEVLQIKYGLGIRTRRLYRTGDREGLRALAQNEYAALVKKIGAFYTAFSRAWHREKKQNGFEVHDVRIGGLAQRVKNCKKTLLDYCNGKLEEIDQLEEEILDCFGGGSTAQKQSAYINDYAKSVSVNFL